MAKNTKKKDTSNYPEYVQRMIAEGKALRKNTYALAGYLQSPAGLALSAEKRHLMDKQLAAMRTYSDILSERIVVEEKEL